jgi:hypothetical protein
MIQPYAQDQLGAAPRPVTLRLDLLETPVVDVNVDKHSPALAG